MINSSSSSMSSQLWLLLFFLAFVLILLPFHSNGADPDPLQDICVADLNAPISVNGGFPCKPATEVTSDDFFFDASQEGNTSTAFSTAITGGSVHEFPGLNTQGISMIRVDFAAGGINPPHTHPRATESGVVISGKLLVGIVTTANVLYYKVLTAGMVFLIPRSLNHFQLNVGNGKAFFYTYFNSQNPGTQGFAVSLFNTTPPIPNPVLTRSFLVGDDMINTIRSAFTSAKLD